MVERIEISPELGKQYLPRSKVGILVRRTGQVWRRTRKLELKAGLV